MPEVASVAVGDPSGCWERLGFVVVACEVVVSGIRFRLDAGMEPGLSGWCLRGGGGVADIDGLPTAYDPRPAPPTPAHPNGVFELDHLVLATPDLDRSVGELGEAGFDLRRVRDAGRVRQAFFRAGAVVLEVVGPPAPVGEAPLALAGLAWTVADLDATGVHLGTALRPAKPAVQPGRRIATLDRDAGSTVAMAFMTPR